MLDCRLKFSTTLQLPIVLICLLFLMKNYQLFEHWSSTKRQPCSGKTWRRAQSRRHDSSIVWRFSLWECYHLLEPSLTSKMTANITLMVSWPRYITTSNKSTPRLTPNCPRKSHKLNMIGRQPFYMKIPWT